MSEVNLARPLEFYQRLVARATCRFCGGDLGPLEVNPDFGAGGWPVVGYPQPVWLYAKCLDCEYAWALWKLIQDLKHGGYARRVARRTVGKAPPQPRAGMGFCTPGHEMDCQRAKEPDCVCACRGRNHRKFRKFADLRTPEEKERTQPMIEEAERTDPVPEQLSEEERYPEDGFLDSEVARDVDVVQFVEPDDDGAGKI